jgi:hypothetical protein
MSEKEKLFMVKEGTLFNNVGECDSVVAAWQRCPGGRK